MEPNLTLINNSIWWLQQIYMFGVREYNSINVCSFCKISENEISVPVWLYLWIWNICVHVCIYISNVNEVWWFRSIYYQISQIVFRNLTQCLFLDVLSVQCNTYFGSLCQHGDIKPNSERIIPNNLEKPLCWVKKEFLTIVKWSLISSCVEQLNFSILRNRYAFLDPQNIILTPIVL